MITVHVDKYVSTWVVQTKLYDECFIIKQLKNAENVRTCFN